MQSKRSLIVGASLGALITMGAAGAADAQQSADATPPVKPHKAKAAVNSSKEMAAQLDALRDQVDALQRRLDAQNAAEQQTKATADQAASQAAAAKAQAATATAATQAIPAQVQAQVQTAVEAAAPKTDKIYYKGVTLTLGGFGALETIYRTKNETADMASSFSGIPLNNNTVGHTGEFRFSARQSRITALAEGDPTQDVHLAFYGELDFLGAAQTANSNETNSYTPRIRVMYNQIDWANEGLHLLAGQNWSLATMQGKGITPRAEDIPPTIDAQYIPGFTFTRQPQIRLTEEFDKTFWAAVSLENPQTTFYNSSTAYPAGVVLTDTATSSTASLSGFNSANTLSLNHIPDVIAKVAYEPTFADRTMHLEVFGLYRSFYERLNYVNQNVNGGGVGAGLMVPVVPGILDFQLSGMGGKGIGRYGAAQLADVTFNSVGSIKPISEIQALAGLTLHASPMLDIYLFAGEEKESAQAYYGTSATGAVTAYGYGNPLYSNTGCASETATGTCTGNTRVVEQGTAGFWYKPWIGKYGRYQIGMQYSYTERKTFAGNGPLGVAPVANDSMVFASFRYYPF
jgi:hypothetical protein